MLYNNLFSNLREQDLSMDWSADTPVLSLPLLYVPPVGEHVPSPYVPSSQSGINGSNVLRLINPNIEVTLLNYSNNQLTNPAL